MGLFEIKYGVTMTEVAEFISTHRFGNCREGKGTSAEGCGRCRAVISWGRTEDVRHCHRKMERRQGKRCFAPSCAA